MFNPSALTLAMTDAGSGVASGALTGGTAGRTAQLYYSSWTPLLGPKTWTLGDTETIDLAGAAAFSVTPASFGYYQWMAIQLDAGGVNADAGSPVSFQPLVDLAAESVWDRCLSAVVMYIDSLNLDGLSAAKIQKRWWPGIFKNMNPAPPVCMVVPLGAETYPNQLNNTDDVGYNVLVLLVDAINRESKENMTRDLLWRQTISRAFRYQRLSGVPEVYTCEIIPDVVVNPDAFAAGLLVSGINFRFLSREPRGV